MGDSQESGSGRGQEEIFDPASSITDGVRVPLKFSEMKKTASPKDGGGGGGGAMQNQPERKWYMKRPSELIQEQVAKGFDEQSASRRVIQQLQGMLAVQSVRHPARMRKIEEEAVKSRTKMEDVEKRVAVIDSKLDSKPDFAAVVLTGLSSGAFAVFLNRAPDIFRSLMDVQQSVSSVSSRRA